MKYTFKIFLNQVEEYWKLVGEEFIKRFEELTKKKFGFEEVNIYITTISRCPYSFGDKWFMISFLNQPLYCIKIMARELMHFHFLEHEWQRVNKEISEEKTEDLKEAFTALLNLEFKDLLFFEDKGYPAHRELREFIAQEWKKEKDYDNLLNKCIEFLKQEWKYFFKQHNIKRRTKHYYFKATEKGEIIGVAGT